MEDMITSESYPETVAWLEHNAHLMGNFDVYVQARNFKMRVYLFEPENNRGDQALSD